MPGPEPSTVDDPPAARRSQALMRYLSHSFRPFEMFTASPAADTPVAEVLDTVDDLLDLGERSDGTPSADPPESSP